MNLEESMAMLNDRQREAVDHVDGPLLVVAGPGTGKTQLLSLRAANILATRDVQPENILCLTYTEAGAEAMQKRLVELVGRDAYGIEVSTFHSFASSVKSRYPEFFRRDPTASAVSDLHSKEILDAYLKNLPYGTPLSAPREGVAASLGGVVAFISKLKRSGLKPDDYRAIMRQNIACADYLDDNDELMGLLNADMPRSAAMKADYIARFEELVHAARACAPVELVDSVVDTPGIYAPYITWLSDLVGRTELIEGNSSKGFTDIRNKEFAKGDDGLRRASVREKSEKALVACDAYEHYQAALADEGFIDFDDMIMDCIAAIEDNPELKYALQDRYRYIQVDEFQDTNGAQMRIVELLCEGIDAPNVMAVGDDDQAIMRFQGASVAYIEQFQERFDAHSVVLEVNYRSTPEIVSLGSRVADQVEYRLEASAAGKRIRANRESGEQVEFTETVYPSKELEYQALARDIKAQIDGGFIDECRNSDEAIAVISCKHAGLKQLIPYLVQEGVPFAYTVRSNVFAMESMQTLLALLRFVAALSQGRADLADSYLPQIVAAPELGGDHPSSVAFALEARRVHGSWMQALAKSENARLKALHDDLETWCAAAPTTPVRELVFEMARRPLKHYVGLQGENPFASAEFNSGIRALLKFVEGELGTSAKLGRTLRLHDVVERLDQAERFGVQIDAAINIGTPGAVRLTTAHSSKGLEFDLVYLLDADDKTWHSSGRSSGLYARNVLLADEKDPDDHRRLLFVAVTRAKTRLELFRAEGIGLREFKGADGESDAVSSVEGRFEAADLAEAIQVDWRQSYALDTPELAALLAGQLPPKHLSASALNAFVEYEDGQPGCEAFPEEQVLRLPQAPAIPLEFGTIVHAYLQDYVDHVLKAGDMPGEELVEKRLAEVGRMDFRAEDVEQYKDRFKRIAAAFGSWAQDRLTGPTACRCSASATCS